MSLLQSEIMPQKEASRKELVNFFNLSEFESNYHNKKLSEYLEKLIENNLDTDDLELKFKIGVTYFALGKYILANEYLEESINYSPRLVYYILGLSCFNKGKVFEKSGNFTATKNNYDKAVFYYKKALNEKGRKPDNSIIFVDLGAVFYELEDFHQLSSILRDLIKEKSELLYDKLYEDYKKTIHEIKPLIS